MPPRATPPWTTLPGGGAVGKADPRGDADDFVAPGFRAGLFREIGEPEGAALPSFKAMAFPEDGGVFTGTVAIVAAYAMEIVVRQGRTQVGRLTMERFLDAEDVGIELTDAADDAVDALGPGFPAPILRSFIADVEGNETEIHRTIETHRGGAGWRGFTAGCEREPGGGGNEGRDGEGGKASHSVGMRSL